MQWSGYYWYFLWSPILPISFSNPLRTVPSAPITMSITISSMFLDFLNSQAKSKYLYLVSAYLFSLWFTRTVNSTKWKVLFFLLINTEPEFLIRIGRSFYISKSKELWTTSFIESTGVTCSDSVSHNRIQVLSILVLLLAGSQDWACNLQMIVSLEA